MELRPWGEDCWANGLADAFSSVCVGSPVKDWVTEMRNLCTGTSLEHFWSSLLFCNRATDAFWEEISLEWKHCIILQTVERPQTQLPGIISYSLICTCWNYKLVVSSASLMTYPSCRCFAILASNSLHNFYFTYRILINRQCNVKINPKFRF